jgi:hypothetical protein
MEHIHENPVYQEGEPDADMAAFIDGLVLAEEDKSFLKDKMLKFLVHEEIGRIWHYLETQGEDHRPNATQMIRDLVQRLKA